MSYSVLRKQAYLFCLIICVLYVLNGACVFPPLSDKLFFIESKTPSLTVRSTIT